MRWNLSWRSDPRARELADRHYSRRKVGTAQFVPPGRCLVLYAENENGRAYWVTSWQLEEYTKHAWAGAWVCSAFRNEGAGLSSELIVEAVAATVWRWEPPEIGMVTFVDPTKVRKKRDFGRCYRKAGFKEVGKSKDRGLVVLQLLPKDMPGPVAPNESNMSLFDDAGLS
mgnify:CR=1 FL=1